MQEFAGAAESSSAGEGGGSASEQASEKAREQFRDASAQSKQQAKDERKARHRDDRVAQTIKDFMSDEQYAHFFQLISRLAARDCPSVFILALLSLIHNGAREAVEEYIVEQKIVLNVPNEPSSMDNDNGLSSPTKEEIVLWISRLSLVMSIDTEQVLSRLMVDENNIDGTVLQLATFVLVEFFMQHKRPVPFEELQPMTVKILQDVIEPHMAVMEAYFARLRNDTKKDDDSDEN